MAGHTSFNVLREKMSAQRRQRIARRADRESIRILLAQLRRKGGMTQAQLAARLGVSQPVVARMESQTDLRVRTLGRIVNALGGNLEIVAHLPDGDVRVA